MTPDVARGIKNSVAAVQVAATSIKPSRESASRHRAACCFGLKNETRGRDPHTLRRLQPTTTGWRWWSFDPGRAERPGPTEDQESPQTDGSNRCPLERPVLAGRGRDRAGEGEDRQHRKVVNSCLSLAIVHWRPSGFILEALPDCAPRYRPSYRKPFGVDADKVFFIMLSGIGKFGKLARCHFDLQKNGWSGDLRSGEPPVGLSRLRLPGPHSTGRRAGGKTDLSCRRHVVVFTIHADPMRRPASDSTEWREARPVFDND